MDSIYSLLKHVSDQIEITELVKELLLCDLLIFLFTYGCRQIVTRGR